MDHRCKPACPQDQALIVSRTILPICSPASIRAWAAAASANGNTRSITGENSTESISGQTLRRSSTATIVLNSALRALSVDPVSISRPEERRGGKEGVGTWRSRWATDTYKKKNKKKRYML